MKTKLIPLILIAASLCSSRAQSSAKAPTSENRATGLSRSSTTFSSSSASNNDELAKAQDNLASARLKHTELSPVVVDAKKRLAELERDRPPGDLPSGVFTSTGVYGQRLGYIVRRGDTAPPGSIILTSAMSQEKLDALSEDLTVLNFIFTRNFERTFGEKGAEYRLGIPMTMTGGRFVETSYIEDFGVLVKIHVPFTVVSSGETEKKSAPAPKTDTDWEKARRALFGGSDAEGAAPTTDPTAVYDEKLVGELKKQIFDALKSAANVRTLDANQTITVVVIGGPNGAAKPARSTVMTIRITKAQADTAAKNPDANDLWKDAAVIGYFDSANAYATPRGVTTYGGGGYGSGFGGVGAYPSAAAATR
jgi:hypothetical protein